MNPVLWDTPWGMRCSGEVTRQWRLCNLKSFNSPTIRNQDSASSVPKVSVIMGRLVTLSTWPVGSQVGGGETMVGKPLPTVGYVDGWMDKARLREYFDYFFQR